MSAATYVIEYLVLESLTPAAEDRRKNPPRKVVRICYNKEKRKYNTTSVKPKLLSDHSGKKVALSQDLYAVCFEETIVLQASDLQLVDEGKRLTLDLVVSATNFA